MQFNFTLDYTYINSAWFEDKNSLFGKLNEKVFYLYLSLYRFRLHKQNSKHVFVTSISGLSKETGYAAKDVLDYLLKLKRYKLIKIQGYSRTEYFYDDNGEIKNKEWLVIEECEEEYEFNIPIDFGMIQHYLDTGLEERYIALYCLLRKLSNGNVERKSYMSIENMAKILKFDKDAVHRMVYELNKRYLLYSWKVEVIGEKNKTERFEHKLCYEYGILGEFKKEYKKNIDLNMKKWIVKN